MNPGGINQKEMSISVSYANEAKDDAQEALAAKVANSEDITEAMSDKADDLAAEEKASKSLKKRSKGKRKGLSSVKKIEQLLNKKLKKKKLPKGIKDKEQFKQQLNELLNELKEGVSPGDIKEKAKEKLGDDPYILNLGLEILEEVCEGDLSDSMTEARDLILREEGAGEAIAQGQILFELTQANLDEGTRSLYKKLEDSPPAPDELYNLLEELTGNQATGMVHLINQLISETKDTMHSAEISNESSFPNTIKTVRSLQALKAAFITFESTAKIIEVSVKHNPHYQTLKDDRAVGA